MLSPGPVTFKATLSAHSLASLPGHGLLVAEGPDALAFLQAQLMNDVRALAIGRWQWNGWLSAKGRLVALMALLRTAEDRFMLVLPDFPAQDLKLRLQRYVFRSKVRLSVPEGWRCAAEFGSPHGGPADEASGNDEAGWRLDMSGAGGARALWLLPPGSAAAADSVDAAWREQDLTHGLPRLPPQGVEAWTPQMLSLERLRAFSLSKGCYPGQEIVARTHYLGKAKRALLRISGRDLQVGDALMDVAGTEVGQLACASDDGGQALAVVALERAQGDMSVSGRAVQLLPLADGLARPL